MSSRVLYISYDGLLEPLGQSQVVSYIMWLAAKHQISVISYEKPHDWADTARRQALADKLQAAGIGWYPLRYHKRFSIAATAWDVAVGLSVSRRLVNLQATTIVHARSYVPSLIALALKRRFGVRFLFDMRGLWPDEKVDAGTWSRRSLVYRIAKRFEKRFLLSADVVVSLTEAGVRAIRRFAYLRHVALNVVVIPTCVDLKSFTPYPDARTPRLTLGYVGNAAGWYDFDAFLNVYSALKLLRPDARLLIVNQGTE